MANENHPILCTCKVCYGTEDEPRDPACVDHGCDEGERCLAGCLCGRCDYEAAENAG